MFSLFRYKTGFFSRTNASTMAKDMLLLELQKITEEGTQDVQEPPTKTARTDQTSSSCLDRIFNEIANEQAAVALTPGIVCCTAQLETYLGEPPLAREDDPLQYWKVNKVRFPTLAKMACRYLSAPCSSVESERLFSSAANIVNESRNRLTPEHAEMILFLKKKSASCIL